MDNESKVATASEMISRSIKVSEIGLAHPLQNDIPAYRTAWPSQRMHGIRLVLLDFLLMYNLGILPY